MWHKIILLSKTELFDGYSIAFNKPFFTYYIIQFSKEGFHWLRFTELVNGVKETPITWTNQPINLKEKVNLFSCAHRWLRVSRAQRWLRVSRA